MLGCGHHHRRAGKDEDHQRHGEQVDHDDLHLRGLDLLAEKLRGPTHHEPGDEHRQEREGEHPVEPGTEPARADLTEHDVDERHHPAEWRHAVVRADHRAGRGMRGDGRVVAAGRRTEPRLLAFHVPAALGRRHRLIGAGSSETRIAVRLEDRGEHGRREEQDDHCTEHREPLLAVLGKLAEDPGQRERQHQDQVHLEHVRDPVRVLERMRRVGVVGPTAVVAHFLDRLLARDRPARDLLGSSLDRRRSGVAVGVHHDALAHHDQRADERERQQDPHDAPHEVGPEVADRVALTTHQASDQGNGDREAHRRRREVLHGEPDHLGEVAHVDSPA